MQTGNCTRLWFAHTPSLRDDAKPAARSDAESRYRQFIDYVVQEFSDGRRFVDGLPREAVGDDDALDAIAADGRSAPESR